MNSTYSQISNSQKISNKCSFYGIIRIIKFLPSDGVYSQQNAFITVYRNKLTSIDFHYSLNLYMETVKIFLISDQKKVL